MAHGTRMSEFSKSDTAKLAPIAESIQPLFNMIIATYLPTAIAAGVHPQLAIGFLVVGLNAQLASILAVACDLDHETSLSLKGDFYDIGSALQQTMAQSVADMILEFNRKQTEGN